MRALLEPFTLVFLLPVFFTYSGLNTQLTMVEHAALLWIALGILRGIHLREVRRLLGRGASRGPGPSQPRSASARS